MADVMEGIDLPEGEEVTLTIKKESSAENIEAFRGVAGSWHGRVDAEDLLRKMPSG